MSKEKIFVDVAEIGDLANILGSFAEDDLVKYDRDSRKQICVELLSLCNRFKVVPPKYLCRLDDSQDLYDAQAKLRGIRPQAPIDYVNMEYDTDFVSLEGFRKWLAAEEALEQQIENASALAAPEDDEMKEFLKPGEVA
jgi:hypothetical protein